MSISTHDTIIIWVNSAAVTTSMFFKLSECGNLCASGGPYDDSPSTDMLACASRRARLAILMLTIDRGKVIQLRDRIAYRPLVPFRQTRH